MTTPLSDDSIKKIIDKLTKDGKITDAASYDRNQPTQHFQTSQGNMVLGAQKALLRSLHNLENATTAHDPTADDPAATNMNLLHLYEKNLQRLIGDALPEDQARQKVLREVRAMQEALGITPYPQLTLGHPPTATNDVALGPI